MMIIVAVESDYYKFLSLGRFLNDKGFSVCYAGRMDQIWAPWRMPYIRAEKPTGDVCFLCAKAKETRDAENLILLRGKTAFVILNAFPYSPGHLLVAPYRHSGEMDDLSEQEMLEMFELTRRCRRLLDKTLRAEGFNIGLNLGKIAGAGLPDHLHIHIVPRWTGDTNFMPILADTRVMPEAMKEVYQKLKVAL